MSEVTAKDKVEAGKKEATGKKEKKEKEVVEEKTGKVDTKISITVNVDNSFEDVLELDKKGFLINFDTEKFLKLSDDEIDKLSHGTKRNYFVTEGRIKERENTGRDAKKMYVDDFKKFTTSPFQGMARKVLEPPRVRKGWHFCWKAPEEVETSKMYGYKIVREPTKEQKEEGYEVGYEKGPMVRVGAGESPELIAMECPEHLYQQHLAAVSYQSSGRFEQKQEEWRETVTRAGLNPIVDDAEGEWD